MSAPASPPLPLARILWDRLKAGQLGLPLFIVAVAIVTGLVEPRFWSVDNLLNLSRQVAPLMILVAGQVFAVIARGLDLSIAAVLALSGVVGILALKEVGMSGAIAAMLATGLGIGLVNGVIIVRFKVSPLIVTLGMLSIARGLSLLVTGGLPLYDVPGPMVDRLGYGAVLGVPVPALVALGALLFGAFLLRYTVFGRHVYAIGSSPMAAYNSGIDIGRTTVLVYVLCGGMAGVGGVVLTSWVSAAQPLAAQGLELQSLAAVVVGGVALTGGSGTMLQAFYGALILGMLSNVLNMAGVSSFLQTLLIGVVIVAAVILDQLRRTRR
jgi:ribose transport system permease protein